MELDIDKIKQHIIRNTSRYFDNSHSTFAHNHSPNFNFEQAVDVFLKITILRVNIVNIDGMCSSFIRVLNEWYFIPDKRQKSVESLANDLEPYFKKILFIKENKDYSSDTNATLLPLWNSLQIHSFDITKKTLDNLDYTDKQNIENYLYNLNLSYKCRNQVHNSPELTDVESSQMVESILIIYLLATICNINILQKKLENSNIEISSSIAFQMDAKTQAIRDFIVYNSKTSKIREEIIISYILYILFEQTEKSLSLREITKLTNKNFNTNKREDFYKNLINNIKSKDKNKIETSGPFNEDIKLTKAENERISKSKESLNTQENFFKIALSSSLSKYNISSNKEEIIEELINLFTQNINIDLNEILDSKTTINDTSSNVKAFIHFLTGLTKNETHSIAFFKELLFICKDHDFIFKIAAARSFARINDFSEIQEYINQSNRIVYLDTNVLLHCLCVYYYEDSNYENINYRSAYDLINIADNSKNKIQLRTTNVYVKEVAYQVKDALLLILLDSSKIFENLGHSDNVFFKFYTFLKTNGLADEVNTFADFMQEFGFLESDLSKVSFQSKTQNSIKKILGDLNIKVDQITEEVDPIKDIEKIIQEYLLSSNRKRENHPIKNDAAMIFFLSHRDDRFNDDQPNNEPIFTTWDTLFYEVRKSFFSEFTNAGKWHLFSPINLITHLHLLNFKIDSESLSQNFVQLVDNFNFQGSTRSIIDTYNQFFDINPSNRREYVKELKRLREDHILNSRDSPERLQEPDISETPVEIFLINVYKYYSNENNSRSFDDLKYIFNDTELLEEVTNIIKTGVDDYKIQSNFESTFLKFNLLIDRKKNKKRE